MVYFFVHIKMSYYQFSREELLQKENDSYHNCGGKEKAAEYYIANEDVLKENANDKNRHLPEEEKEAQIRQQEKNRYR